MPREWQKFPAMADFEIQLRDVMIFARHGVMPEEERLGNQYRVNVRLRMCADAFDHDADDIVDTVSYADVYDILMDVMNNPKRLLESVALDFASKCRKRWALIKNGEIEIVKVVPPIPGMIGEAGVKYIF